MGDPPVITTITEFRECAQNCFEQISNVIGHGLLPLLVHGIDNLIRLHETDDVTYPLQSILRYADISLHSFGRRVIQCGSNPQSFLFTQSEIEICKSFGLQPMPLMLNTPDDVVLINNLTNAVYWKNVSLLAATDANSQKTLYRPAPGRRGPPLREDL